MQRYACAMTFLLISVSLHLHANIMNHVLIHSLHIVQLTGQVEKLSVIGRELKRKQRQAQMQARGLVEERADFLAQLQDQNRELINLRARLGLAKKENEDLSKLQGCPDLTNKAVYDLDDPDRPRFTTAELKEILHERNELKARVSDLEDELELYRPKPEMYVPYMYTC